MKMTPKRLKRLVNLYGPYLGAGINVDYISEDWRTTRVSMQLRWYNRNAMSVHFGGSLYAMVDPHLMLMLMQILGSEYSVWDQSARIDFIKPGRGKVSSELTVTDQDLETIKLRTQSGEKYLHHFYVTILDAQGERVADVEKILYFRKRTKNESSAVPGRRF